MKLDIEKYYKANFPQEVFIKQVLSDNIKQFIEIYIVNSGIKEPRILDVGCGNQPFRNIFEKLGLQYSGLDYKQNSTNTVSIVEPIDSEFISKYPNLQPYDFIICTEVLEHVAQWDIAFKNMHNLTKNGGKVLITCPHFYQLHEVPYDFWRPTPYALEFYAKKAGFKILENKKVGNSWDVLGTFLGSISSFKKKGPLNLKYFLLFHSTIFLKKWLYKNIVNKRLTSNICIDSPMYLSNIFIMEK